MKENNELTREDLAIDRDMQIDGDEGREILVYIETWFDVDKKFGTHICDEDDTWLNMYGHYNPLEDSLWIECEISRQDSSEYFDYTPTASEMQLIKDMITEKIREVYDQTPQIEMNSDCVGWLFIPDTAVNYPVMHTPASPQKYLHLSFDGQSSASGVPFLDGRCSMDSDNLIIYGHNMKNGTMFGTLKRYTDKSYLAEHPIIELETESGCVQYAVFAVVSVKTADEWYSFITAYTQEDYDRQIDYLREKAMLKTDVMPVFGQQLLTLSTCYGSNKDGRLLVVAVSMKKL